MVHFASLVLGVLAACAPLSFASPVVVADPQGSSISKVVKLRIEGAEKTIFEGEVQTKPRNLTTASGGTHHCDGTNNGNNPAPGPTCTTALADAAAFENFTWDGTYSTTYDDFFVTRIDESTQTATEFWGLLLNWQFTSASTIVFAFICIGSNIIWLSHLQVGGCQQQVALGDSVLWAYDAFDKAYFLKLDGPATAHVGVPIQVTVTDGSTGVKVSGASIAGIGASTSGLTDADGHVMVTFVGAGSKKIKAQRDDSLRSNSLTLKVSA